MQHFTLGAIWILLELLSMSSLAADQKPDQPTKIPELVKANWDLTFTERDGTKTVVGLRMGRLSVSEIHDIEALTDLQEYQFEGIGLGGNDLTDAMLVHLKDLSHLKKIKIFSSNISGDGLEFIKGLGELTILGVSLTNINDTGLAHIQNMSQLEELDLGYTKITSDGLAHLKRLTHLRHLKIGNTTVTDAGLVHIQELSSLTNLSLEETKVTDTGLAVIKRLHNLNELNLFGTQVTDAGLQHIKVLSKLVHIHLEKTKVTKIGVDELQKELPRLKIEWEGCPSPL